MTIDDGVGIPRSEAVRFDVREFARTANGSQRGSLPLDAFSTGTLPPLELQALRQLADLESATMHHLRNVLVTATHKDARVTAFLVTWAFEKFWIADAIEAVLEANDAQRTRGNTDQHTNGRRRHDLAEASDRRGPIRRAIAAMAIGQPIIAVHMTSGLIDELVTRASYERLAETDSVALRTVIGRILAIKARHSVFFEQEAERRLRESTRAVALTRRAIPATAWPIGSTERSAADRSWLEEFTFGGEQGRARAAAIAARVSGIFGLDEKVAAALNQRLLP
jgi:hypothetical protein